MSGHVIRQADTGQGTIWPKSLQSNGIERVISADGTRIAYERHGSGPPLVLVHGTTANRTRWARVLPALTQQHTVYTMDRRGRGASGDAEAYALEREFEDVVAVVNSIGGPVDLLGHSFGAVVVLEAALRTSNVRRLVIYEPPPTGTRFVPSQLLRRMEDLLAAGDRDGVVTTFFREAARLPPHELEMMRADPSWPARVAAAHTILRECYAEEELPPFDPARFKRFTTPTLLLLGGESPDEFKAPVHAMHAGLPNSRIAVMPGQRHIAMTTAPDLFVHEVLAFLAE
jgi:pimeloyl-ACP methyl ester carboxylesterase